MRHLRPQTAALAVLALVASTLLLAGCAGAGPSADTADIFAATPFEGGESLRYQLLNGEAEVVGAGVLEATVDGEALALHQRYDETDAPEGTTPAADDVTVWVDPATFRPLRGVREVTARNEDGSTSLTSYEWNYGVDDDGDPAITTVRTDDDGDRDEDTLRLREHYYDNETSLWLWRSIEFVEELDAFYVSVNPMEDSQQTVNLRLPQTETVTVPAGEFEAYRLLFRNGRAVRTAWVEVAAPHRVLRWDNGDTVLELLP